MKKRIFMAALAFLLGACQPPQPMNQAPSAAFSAPSTIQAGLPIAFDASNSSDPEGKPLTYSWNFGDSARGGSKQLAHVYSSAGTFTVSLVVSDEAGLTSSKTQEITVSAAPTATSSSNARVVVKSVAGAPLEGVSVRVRGQPAVQTDASGVATVPAVPNGVSVVLEYNKTGFAAGLRRLELPADATNVDLSAILLPQEAPFTLKDVQNGASQLGLEGAKITLPADALQKADGSGVSGDVQVSITPLNIASSDLEAFPGGSSAVTSAGVVGDLLSYGMVEFKLSQAGQEVNIKPGKAATVEIPVYATTRPNGTTVAVGDSEAYWTLDEQSGLWREEGRGVIVASSSSPTGLAMQASATHFTWVNFDQIAPVVIVLARCKLKIGGDITDLPSGQTCQAEIRVSSANNTSPALAFNYNLSGGRTLSVPKGIPTRLKAVSGAYVGFVDFDGVNVANQVDIILETAGVSVSPISKVLNAGETQQFTAQVTGLSNTAVTWKVNDVVGGNDLVGTISPTGLYTAPIVSAQVIVKGESQADPSKNAIANVTVSGAIIGFNFTGGVAGIDETFVRDTLNLNASIPANLNPDRIEWVAGNTVVASDTTAPYQVVWDSSNLAEGTYTLLARAVRGAAVVNSQFSQRIIVDRTAPSLVSISPFLGSSNVALSTPVIAVFSEKLRPVVPANVVIAPGISTSLTQSADGRTVTIAPNSWATSTNYNVQLQNFADPAGNPVGNVVTAFNTIAGAPSKTWSAPSVVVVNSPVPNFPRMVSNQNGQAMIIYREGSTSVLSSTYLSGNTSTTWSATTRVNAGLNSGAPSDDALNTDLALSMNSSGQVAIFFNQNSALYFNRFTPVTGWETPQLVASNFSDVSVSINEAGNSMLVYGTGSNVFSRLVLGSTLQPVAQINTTRVSSTSDLDIRVVLGTDRAIALWQDKADAGSPTLDLQMGIYNISTGVWTTSTLSAGLNTLDNICLRMNSSGQAIAAWRTNKPSLISRIEAAFIGLSGTPSVQDLTRGNAPQCSINNAGTALVSVKTQNSAGTGSEIKAFAYSSSWDTGTTLLANTIEDGFLTDPQISINASGNALIGAFNATTSALTTDKFAGFRVLSSGTWQTAQTITNIDPNGQDTYTRHLNFDDSGNGFYIFQTNNEANLAMRNSVQILYYR
jgi:hypothetical protein